MDGFIANGKLTQSMNNILPKYVEMSDGDANLGALRLLSVSLSALAHSLIEFVDGTVPMDEFNLLGFANGIVETAFWIRTHTGDTDV